MPSLGNTVCSWFVLAPTGCGCFLIDDTSCICPTLKLYLSNFQKGFSKLQIVIVQKREFWIADAGVSVY